MPEMSATHPLEADPRLAEPGVSPEPLAAPPGPRAARPHEILDVQDEDPELGRLETLLHARTRQAQALASELARCDRLLREALLRIPSLASSELQALRRGYDAAVERAIEAEVARAELTFALDETRAQLTAAPTSSGAVGAVGAVEHRAVAPGVYARVAELEEAEGSLHARLVLAEQDRDSAQGRIRELTRELQETGERVELHLARERAQEQALAARGGREHVLAAYAAGLAARADEAEGAFRAAYTRAQLLEQRLADKQAGLAEARAETAEQLVQVQSQAARIEELQRSLAQEQQEQRSLRAQVEASVAAQLQQTAAREADEAQWAERVRELSEREQRATALLASADAELRKLLGSVKQPLSELHASLDALGPDARMLPVDEALRSDTTEPGTVFEGVSDAPLVEQLRQRERQVAELEAALARYGQSPSTVGLAQPGARTETMRLTDELARERTRRKRLGATVRALQAASEAGEPTAPWIQELASILTEGASLPPK